MTSEQIKIAKLNRLVGELSGLLEGALMHNIPLDLRMKLEPRFNQLKQEQEAEDIVKGNQYESRLEDSSGRTYEVIDDTKNNGNTINLKDINSTMTVTYSRAQIQTWITEGRLKLVGKNLLA